MYLGRGQAWTLFTGITIAKLGIQYYTVQYMCILAAYSTLATLHYTVLQAAYITLYSITGSIH